uniref:Uncharacterized protein n=1 Tax=Meloidogyne floridensis TaxID=298350 RepID=A0A915NL47_9BILA
MRGNIRIVLDDIDDIPSTSQNNAQNNFDDMQRENLERRNQRLEKDKERKRRNRKTNRNKEEWNDWNNKRLGKELEEKMKKKARRENELDEERVMRLDQRNLRYRNRIRDEIRLFAAGDHRNVIVNRLGRMNVECTH